MHRPMPRLRVGLARLALLLGAAVIPVDGASAAPVACSAFVAPHIAWATNPQGLNPGSLPGTVRFALVSNYASGLVGYTEGYLAFSDPAIWGIGNQYVNDRRYESIPYPTPPAVNQPRYPFDPLKSDKLEVRVWPDGTVTLTLLSWGGGEIHLLHPTCDQGVLTAVVPGDSSYMLTLRDEQPNAVPRYLGF